MNVFLRLLAYANLPHTEGASAHSSIGQWQSFTIAGLSGADVQALLGLTLIVAAAVGLNRTSLYPGWWALLPTLGTCLLISAGPSAGSDRRWSM